MGPAEFVLAVQGFLGYNRYLTAAIILVFFFIISKVVIVVMERIFLRLASHTATDLDDKIIKHTSNPISLLILIIGFRLFFVELWDGYAFERYLRLSLNSAMAIIVVYTVMKILDEILLYLGNTWAKRTKSHLDDQLIKLFGQIITVAGYVVMLLLVLSTWGIQIGPLLAGIGIGGLAIAFALQPTLANVFGGISLILDKAVKVDDVIKLDTGESGKVFDIGLRSTRIKTWTNEILIVPNSKLVDSKVTNFNQPDRTIRIDIKFGVAYGSKINPVKKIALSCLTPEKHILKDPEPYCWFLEMGDSALLFELRFFVDDLDNRWATHQNVIERLYNGLNKAKINIPFPQRELWVHNLKK